MLLSEAKLIPDTSMNFFIHYLEDNGYASKTIHNYLGAVIHFFHWQHQQSGIYKKLTKLDKFNFVNLHLPNCQCFKVFPKSKNNCSAALSHWLRQVTEVNDTEVNLSENDKLVQTFEHYLKDVAGLSSATCLYRCRYAKEFLIWTHYNQLIPLDSLTVEHLSTFICYRATKVSLASIAVIACSLNSFLRFLTSQGLCHFSIEFYVPRPKQLYCLPDKKSLSEEELNLLLKAIDNKDPIGKRDYAITRCLLDLGIRTSEVANITLDDIDWRNKVITINPGKSRRQHKLPIPATLMEALIDYIKNGRPETKTRHVFVFHHAPVGQPVNITTIRGVVRRAFAKAGFESSQSQVHRLRHTMATRLLMNEVPLKTIADILGHQSIDTTTRYTHINLKELQSIASPWPGEIES
jgi:site-specific recombinase XerD